MPAKTPIFVAHRGLHDSHTENSLAAFKAAWSSGINWCECDVHLSSDDVPVVIHDDTVDRTTTGTGFVNAISAKVLKKMGVPTLDEVIAAMPENARLLVEYKPPHPTHPALLAMAKKLASSKFILQSFNLDQILGVTEQYLKRAVLTEDLQDLEHPAAREIERIHLRHDLLTPVIAKELRARTKSIGVWTPNADAELQRVYDIGVDMIITDRPHWRPPTS
jgi:glycerophosphoryl diester phosphodiesterase